MILKAALRDRRSTRAIQQNVAGFYADNFGMFPAGVENARCLVIKCHAPSASVRFLTRALRGKTLISVRDPRDAVASLMQRFHHPFDGSAKDVGEHASLMLNLSGSENALVLKYEDRFFEAPETIATLAAFLNVRISASSRDRIFRSLRAETVRRKIEKLQTKGTFGRTPAPDAFDPKTHWHPGHVGDGQVGKFSNILTKEQQKAIVDATRPYMEAFGYMAAPKRTVKKPIARRQRT